MCVFVVKKKRSLLIDFVVYERETTLSFYICYELTFGLTT